MGHRGNMSARRAAAESARLARLRERVRYLQQDLVNGTLYHKKLYVPDRTAKDGIDGCLEEMFTRLDGHLPNKPFHQMRHIKPSVRRFQEREGLGFRNWLSWVRECQSIIAPDIFSPMNPPSCTYAENQEDGVELNDFDNDDHEEAPVEFETDSSFLPDIIPIGRISVRLPPEDEYEENEDENQLASRPEGAEEEEEDEGEYEDEDEDEGEDEDEENQLASRPEGA